MLADRLYDAMTATFDLLAVYVGERLGWYTALAQEPRTAAELPAEHAEVLLDPESLLYAAPLARFAVSLPLEDLLDAYRDGGGVPWDAYGADGREAQAALNRPLFTHLLTQEWLPAIPDVHEQLQNGARVAELACGGGWASIAIAKAYPHAEVHGFDVDEASIELARANAAGVARALRGARHRRGDRRLRRSLRVRGDPRPGPAGRGTRRHARRRRHRDRHGRAHGRPRARAPAVRRPRPARSCGRRPCAATRVRPASTTPPCSTSSTRASASTG